MEILYLYIHWAETLIFIIMLSFFGFCVVISYSNCIASGKEMSSLKPSKHKGLLVRGKDASCHQVPLTESG